MLSHRIKGDVILKIGGEVIESVPGSLLTVIFEGDTLDTVEDSLRQEEQKQLRYLAELAKALSTSMIVEKGICPHCGDRFDCLLSQPETKFTNRTWWYMHKRLGGFEICQRVQLKGDLTHKRFKVEINE